MQAELEFIIAQLSADTGTIHLIEDGALILKAHVGLPLQVVQSVTNIPIGKGMAGLAAARNEPVSSCNIQTDQTGDVRVGAKKTGIRGAVVVPICNECGKVLGTLGIGVNRKHKYCDDEIACLLKEASRIAKQVHSSEADRS
jgi:L-methionine (R)-S-oxide reductase